MCCFSIATWVLLGFLDGSRPLREARIDQNSKQNAFENNGLGTLMTAG